MEQIALNWESARRQYTVSELTDEINAIFREAYAEIWVAGEVSGVKASAAGHVYFTLKDERAQLQCACFKMSLLRMRVKPQEGLAILARGRLELYPQRGQHQLIVDQIELQGLGALQLAFEQLKSKLKAEGLFDGGRKRPLPAYPRRIGIVTSPTGAVIQDMMKILARRAPGLHIRLYPAQVQGDGAAAQIRRGIDYFSDSGWAEVVIAGRGGGSLEDLWAFNEEVVARAIAACRVPVISAVGHETDFTIADFVADLRAPTPSAAAEIVTAQWVALPARLTAEVRHLSQAVALRLSQSRNRLDRQGVDRARAVVTRQLNRFAQRLDDLSFRLREAIRGRVAEQARRLRQAAVLLQRQDPQLRLLQARNRWANLTARLEDALRRRLALDHPRLESQQRRLQEVMENHLRVFGRLVTQQQVRLLGFDPQRQLLQAQVRHQSLAAELEERIRRRLAAPLPRIDRARSRLDSAALAIVHRHRLRLESMHAALTSLSPLRVLERGYAIVQEGNVQDGNVQDGSRRILKDPPPAGTALEIRYASGRGTAVAGPIPEAPAPTGPTPADNSELPS